MERLHNKHTQFVRKGDPQENGSMGCNEPSTSTSVGVGVRGEGITVHEPRKTNLLLVGFGPHAKRIYYPIVRRDEATLNAQIVYGVDLAEKKDDVERYLGERGESLPLHFISPEEQKEGVSGKTKQQLEAVVDEYGIDGVIIATEPSSHVDYAKWALDKGLHVLMDKPLSAVPNASTSEAAASQLVDDYEELKAAYTGSKSRHEGLVFNLLAQRRFHPAFIRMKDLVREVFETTNCPITSIQSFHSDGQWRLPSEIVDITYHSYNDGYGKVSHSGYHSLDIATWLQEAAEAEGKRVDNVDVFTNFSRPVDFMSQVTVGDYQQIFPDFARQNRYSEGELLEATQNYGEIDAFNSFAFKHGERTITLGSVNLVHNGFSQRGWLLPADDLYKKNGRVRHETHLIEQGPFQAIAFESYQSQQLGYGDERTIFEAGGEYHLDIHVFRNSSLFPQWKPYEKIGMQDLGNAVLTDYSRGHQEDARREAIVEFVELAQGMPRDNRSDLLSHEHSVKLMSGIYQSAARRFNGSNPLVNVRY